MSTPNTNWITSFIWNIADDVLRDVYVRGKYRDVILPMTVIRRLDAVLEPTKQKVRDRNQWAEENGVASKDVLLKDAAGQSFYNISPFRLRDLRSRGRAQQLRSDFETYLEGFSPNVQEILQKFAFQDQVVKMSNAGILGNIIDKFTTNTVNLGPEPMRDDEERVLLPGLDNHAMGTIFEELIRRFNEENNKEAGEHFTPRDVVRLMTDLIFLPIANQIKDATYLVYDGAAGTGGMLTVAEERLQELAHEHHKTVSIHLYGQEINAETFAIAKADLLLKGEGSAADNMAYGSTLSADAFTTLDFDFMLSNPPYGKSWVTDLERMGGKKHFNDRRFVVQHGGFTDAELDYIINPDIKYRMGDALGGEEEG